MVNDDTPITTPEQSEQWAVFVQVLILIAVVACTFIFLVLKD